MVATLAKEGFIEEVCLEPGPGREDTVWRGRGGRDCRR